MKPLPAPRLESRRAVDFERELIARARVWIPSWSLDESQADFGLALLKIAARFSSEVAERLDVAGNKMALGFLDWLGLPAAAARPARMPVVLKMTDSAVEPVLAAHPIKMQVDVPNDTVTFETETDLQVIPGQLAAIVAADPEQDAYYLPPPGLSSLAPLDPLPIAWTVKNFAAPGSATLQLDPGLGLAEGMLVEIAGQQYRIAKAKGDLVTIVPPVPAGDGFAEETAVSRVSSFEPFSGARNLQEHILYIGDKELLNVEAAARIELDGLETAPKDVKWEYWGKSEPEDPADADARWRALSPEAQPRNGPPPPLVLDKPKGSVEIAQDPAQGRWIRARLETSSQVVTTDGVKLRINPADKPPDALTSAGGEATLPHVDIFVNATASTPSDVFLFGQEPRLLDTLYIGSDEAFSKADATAWVNFELSDGAFEAMTAFDRGTLAGGPMLAAVDKGGALNLFGVNQNGKLTRLNGARPLQPEPKDVEQSGGGGATNYRLTSSDIRPAVWIDQTSLCIAAAAKGDIWVRKEPLLQFMGGLFFFGFQQPGTWEYWGAPGGDPDAPVSGMALVAEAGRPTLVVFTAAGLFKRSSGTSWVRIPFADDISTIGTLRTDNPVTVSSEFLLVRKRANGKFELCTVTAAGNPTGRIQNLDPDVQPFGVVSGGTTTLVAATSAPALSAWKTGGTTATVDLGSAELGETALDGSISGGQVTICATGTIPPDPVLLQWLPFDAQFGDLLFASLVDILPGGSKGFVASLPGRVFIPGSRKGEVLTASIDTPASFAAPTGNYRSAVAVRTPPDPSADTEIVAVKTLGGFKSGKVEGTRVNGVGTNAGSMFLWLDTLIDRDTSEDDVFLFKTLAAQPAKAGTVQQAAGDAIDLAQPLPVGDVLLVSDGVNDFLVEIKPPLAGNLVQVSPPTGLASGTPVTYRVSDKASASVHPSIKLDNSNDDWDSIEALPTGLYFPSLEPHHQVIVAYANDQSTPPKPQYVAFEERWTTAPSGAVPITFVVPRISEWIEARSSPAATAELAWEYWNGTGWWHLPIDADDTSNLRQSGMITFTVPDDFEATEWAGKTSHWIRARLIAGDYGEAVVQVVQEPVPNTNPAQTKQTVVRDTSNLQPPYAISVRVAYALNKPVIPQFVLTQDSGALRDQSDANRTPGPGVEIFTPLSVTLGRLDAPAPQNGQGDDCLPDCACENGNPSLSPRPRNDGAAEPAAAPAAGTAGRPAIFLGFTSKLVDGPVNVLFLAANEGAYDQIAPLKVDALIGNRFTPVTAKDNTRALGESELLTMTFDVEPMKAGLFGQALSWLRIAPSVDSADWKPSLAGVYLNGVWAQAAETMTRELLGSSGGEPALTLTLARPPLLQNSLELRVREPLGEEERKALTDEDPNSVRNGIADLPGDWVLWTQVPDPTDCGPKDRVYALDEASGTVRFGDGLHGMIPPPGVDAIIAFAYKRTDPMIGGQVSANLVRPKQELNLVSPVESVETVAAADRSAGGVVPQSADHVLEFAPAKLRNRGRAVSARDFEDLAKENSDDVLQARCFVRNGKVRLVVVVRGADPAPSRAKQRELRRMLLESGPISLGAPGSLTIAGPRVRSLRVLLELGVQTLDDSGDVGKQAKSSLVNRFSTEFGGELGEGWPLGQAPSEDDVAEALLDIPALESIVSVNLFELDEVGVERPWRDPVAPSDLVMLTSENVRVGFKIMEVAA